MPTNEHARSYAVQYCTAVFPCSHGRVRHPVENWLIPDKKYFQIRSAGPKYPRSNILGFGLLNEHYQK